ncbi:hypothetical protein L484_007528 [Morus notabilis]|uniref:Uncharacterized protein n=1 Tax=Morus notabilis TaxID=981085 RepID=W9QW61_9ROSA|nr:hypothetical protein L484_007528 [Morus notabilis]
MVTLKWPNIRGEGFKERDSGGRVTRSEVRVLKIAAGERERESRIEVAKIGCATYGDLDSAWCFASLHCHRLVEIGGENSGDHDGGVGESC